nr:recombinase family protein [Klebsiella aerogenes]
MILVEQVDRLSRLDDAGWKQLKHMIQAKDLSVVSLDLPTSHIAFSKHGSDDFTRSMLSAINGMMLDMLAAIARKDYTDRRRRQKEGIENAKSRGVYRGRSPDLHKHELVRSLRSQGKSISETARLANVSTRTVTRITKSTV